MHFNSSSSYTCPRPITVAVKDLLDPFEGGADASTVSIKFLQASYGLQESY
jgi:hypothetical protein